MSLLIAGLGNPGGRYENTRHNIGFILLDFYREHSKSSFQLTKNQYWMLWCSKDLCLLKPQLYMNRSGDSLDYFFRTFKDDWDDILIIHDDMDIEFGFIKYSSNKGSGGHKGIESINSMLPGNRAKRCRIGISKPPEDKDPAEYVLECFSREEMESIDILLKNAAESIDVFIYRGLSKAANTYNRRDLLGRGEDKLKGERHGTIL